jgi:hypothetical protein
MRFRPLAAACYLFNGAVLILSQKIFSGTGMLPVRVHRLKTCATNLMYGASYAPSILLSGGRRPPPSLSEKITEIS